MKKELATSLGIIVICAFLVQQARALPAPRFEPLGPSFFPLAILYGIIALTTVHIGITLWKARTAAAASAQENAAAPWRPTFAGMMPMVSIAAFAAYALLISYTDIPFLVLTFVFVALLSWTMSGFRNRSIPLIALVAAVLVGAVQWIFVDALNLVLP